MLAQFYAAGLKGDAYHLRGSKADVRDHAGKVLASCDLSKEGRMELLEELVHQTKSTIRLYKEDVEDGGVLRFNEVEMIRMRGTIDGKKVKQRKVVLQRKLSNGQVVNEDFFDFQISIVLPNWPVRFQDERFKTFFTDLVYERCPAHIQNSINWLDPIEMRAFEEAYQDWTEIKLSKFGGENEGLLAKASLNLYKHISVLAK